MRSLETARGTSYLQVDLDNGPALDHYRAVGFQHAYRYVYLGRARRNDAKRDDPTLPDCRRSGQRATTAASASSRREAAARSRGRAAGGRSRASWKQQRCDRVGGPPDLLKSSTTGRQFCIARGNEQSAGRWPGCYSSSGATLWIVDVDAAAFAMVR